MKLCTLLVESSASIAANYSTIVQDYLKPICDKLVQSAQADKMSIQFGLVLFGNVYPYSSAPIQTQFFGSLEDILTHIDAYMGDFVGGGGYNHSLTLDALVAALQMHKDHDTFCEDVDVKERHLVLVTQSSVKQTTCKYNVNSAHDAFTLSNACEHLSKRHVKFHWIGMRKGLDGLFDELSKYNSKKDTMHNVTRDAHKTLYTVQLCGIALDKEKRKKSILVDEDEPKAPMERRGSKRVRAASHSVQAEPALRLEKDMSLPLGELIPPPTVFHSEPIGMESSESTSSLYRQQPETLQQSFAEFSHLPGGTFLTNNNLQRGASNTPQQQPRPLPQQQQQQPALNHQNIQQFVSALQAQQVAANVRNLSFTSPLSPGGPGNPQVNNPLAMQQRYFQELQARRQNLSRRNSVASHMPPETTTSSAQWNTSVHPSALQVQQERVAAASRLLAARMNTDPNNPQQVTKEAIAQQILASLLKNQHPPPQPNAQNDPKIPNPIWNGEITWSTRQGAPTEAGSVKQITFAISAYPALPGNRPTFNVEEYMTHLWPGRLMVTTLVPVAGSDLQRIVFQFNVPYFSILPQTGSNQQSNQVNTTGFSILTKMLECTQKVGIIRLPNMPGNKAIVILWSPMQQKMVGLVFFKTPLDVIFNASASAPVQREPTAQETNMSLQLQVIEQINQLKQQRQQQATLNNLQANLSPQQIATLLMMQRKQ